MDTSTVMVTTMKDVSTFAFGDCRVRVVKDEVGEPWFVAKDICDVLTLANPTEAIRNLDPDEKNTLSLTEGNVRGNPNVNIISESGLFTLILRCRDAVTPGSIPHKFRKWVTSEVLPAIRKHGGYLTPQKIEEVLADPDTIIRLATQLKEERIARVEAEKTAKRLETENFKLETEILENAPKVLFHETFAVSNGNILFRDFAKQINTAFKWSGFGQQQMFDFARNGGWMNENRYPSQKSIDMGILETIEGNHLDSSGIPWIHHTTKITPKGQTYFFKKLKERYDQEGRWW